MVVVKEINVGFSGLFATEDIPKKSVIIKLQGDYLPFPTQTSIEIMKNNHIEDVFYLLGLLIAVCPSPSS